MGGVYGIFKTNTSKNNPYIAPASGTAGTPDPNGGYFNSNGQTETYFTSFVFSYTPSVPVPFISFLYLRGQVSLLIFKDGFANDHFLVHELGGFVGTDLLKPIFIEAGGGHQFFRTQDLSHGFFAFYGGIILNADGFFNRVFVGRTELDGYPVRVEEYTAGLGIQL